MTTEDPTESRVEPEPGLVHKQTDSKLTNLKDVFLLDTGSTIEATVMNPDLITDIKVTNKPITMTTNGGNKQLTLEGTIEGYGRAYYDQDQIANIFGFSHMVDNMERVTYDSAIEDAFNIYTKEGKHLKFTRNNRLYTYKPPQSYFKGVADSKCMEPAQYYQEQSYNMIDTVAGNMKMFTTKQIEAANRARKLQHNLMSPTTENLKLIIRQKILKNCPVTVDDINIAERIYGKDIAALHGKTTRKRSKVVYNDYVEVPPELITQHENISLALDLMFVNGLPMLTSIDLTVRHRALVPLNTRTVPDLCEAIDVILRQYNRAGFMITEIRGDNEFEPLRNILDDEMGVRANIAPQGDHCPEAERNNRVIAERIRAIYNTLPFDAMPKTMLKYLAMEAAERLNYFPAKGGISPYYSPYTLLNKQDIDYAKHCKHNFGAYVEAYRDETIKNDNKPRTFAAIFTSVL